MGNLSCFKADVFAIIADEMAKVEREEHKKQQALAKAKGLRRG